MYGTRWMCLSRDAWTSTIDGTSESEKSMSFYFNKVNKPLYLGFDYRWRRWRCSSGSCQTSTSRTSCSLRNWPSKSILMITNVYSAFFRMWLMLVRSICPVWRKVFLVQKQWLMWVMDSNTWKTIKINSMWLLRIHPILKVIISKKQFDKTCDS